MNNTEFKNYIKQARLQHNISQKQLASAVGVTRQYINEIETGKSTPSTKLKERLLNGIQHLKYDTPLFLLIDYFSVRFSSVDAKSIIENILQCKAEYFNHKDFAFYGYSKQYCFGDIVLMASPDESKGLLLELKGKGCRQLETFLQAQNRSWYDFLQSCIDYGGIIKRIDLAINDVAGLLDIPLLIEKSYRGELITRFKKFEAAHAGRLCRKSANEDDMGSTLYIGSKTSQLYFCLYQKDKEQMRKGLHSDIRNRFEIRLKGDKAEKAIQDLLSTRNPEEVVFALINRYMDFIDTDRSHAVLHLWEWFTGTGRNPIELEMRPEPYAMEHTMKWLEHQVAPTLALLQKADERSGTNLFKELTESVTLKEHHKIKLKQMTTDITQISNTAVLSQENDGIF